MDIEYNGALVNYTWQEHYFLLHYIYMTERGIAMKIKEIIVVEGKNDTLKIKQAVYADTIETNGSAITESTIQIIEHAYRKRGVIIFTDPDYAGERIRKMISDQIPGCKHAFLPKEFAKSTSPHKSVGIEHASVEDICNALQKVYEIDRDNKTVSDILKNDLITYGLIGHPNARARREQLGKRLHIGFTNGKQLLKRLHMFQITKGELDREMKHIIEGGN